MRAEMFANSPTSPPPTLRREAQSTSALEGTYAPLRDVLTAAEDEVGSLALAEVLNYVRAAEYAFDSQVEGRPLTVGLLSDVQARLVRGTTSDTPEAGRVRTIQVVIGSDPSAPVTAARFVPQPPGLRLDHGLRDLLDWTSADRDPGIDPVVEAALTHYQFETLHPFNDGNGRIGRLLIVLQLLERGVLSEPTLAVSPWFETRRSEYYDRLFAVSTVGDWDAWVRFFARGLGESAHGTREQMAQLLAVQEELRDRIRRSGLRADSAHLLVEFAVANPSSGQRRTRLSRAVLPAGKQANQAAHRSRSAVAGVPRNVQPAFLRAGRARSPDGTNGARARKVRRGRSSRVHRLPSSLSGGGRARLW